MISLQDAKPDSTRGLIPTKANLHFGFSAVLMKRKNEEKRSGCQMGLFLMSKLIVFTSMAAEKIASSPTAKQRRV